MTGKLFAFDCEWNARASARVYRWLGNGDHSGERLRPARTLGFPPGTLKVKGEAVCATRKGLSFRPCFSISGSRTGEQSFRGSFTGLARYSHR